MKASPVVSNLEQTILEPYLKDLREIVDSELAKLVSEISPFRLSEQMTYAMLSAGKRLRPILTLLSVGSVGGSLQDAKSLALSVEIMHAATLVHDDILDRDSMRRGVPTVHEKWSVNDAILTGDALLSLALSLITNFSGEVLKAFSEAGMRLAEGEYMDLDPPNSISEEIYVERIKRKSASLFRAATKCGALAGKGSPSEILALASFGENFGMAFQIRDDILDITGPEEDLPNDLKEGRITLPLVHLFNTMTAKEKTEFCKSINLSTEEEILKRRTYFEEILRRLKENGSIDYCKNKINHYAKTAIANIEPLKNSVYKEHLRKLAESLRLA